MANSDDCQLLHSRTISLAFGCSVHPTNAYHQNAQYSTYKEVLFCFVFTALYLSSSGTSSHLPVISGVSMENWAHWHHISNLFGDSVIQFIYSCPGTGWTTHQFSWEKPHHWTLMFGFIIPDRIALRLQNRACWGFFSILYVRVIVLENTVIKQYSHLSFPFQSLVLGERRQNT